MNFKSLAIASLTILLFTGCSLIPKPVEFFQKKVPVMPSKSSSQVELEKKSASFVIEQLDSAYTAALTNSTANQAIITPLNQAKPVASALSTSLGPPENPYIGNGTNLAQSLLTQVSDLDKKINKFQVKITPLENKKVEGTGLIKIPYFLYLGIIIGLIFVIRFVINIVSSVYPPVAVGNTVLRKGSSLVSKALGEVIEGGNHFLESVNKEITDPAIKNKIIEMFKTSHQIRQSRDTQELVSTLNN